MKKSNNNYPPLTPAWMDRWPMNLAVDGDGSGNGENPPTEPPEGETTPQGEEGPPRPDERDEDSGRPVED